MATSIAQQIQDIVRDKMNSADLAPKVMEPIGNHFKQAMQESTKRGNDMTGEGYTPYAPSTQKRKGRSQPVTFRQTGEAMAGVTVSAEGKTAEVSFTSKGEIMYYHQKGEGRNPERQIFPEPPLQDKGEMRRHLEFAGRKFEEYFNE